MKGIYLKDNETGLLFMNFRVGNTTTRQDFCFTC
jgi:hypothetical protein